jgi:cytochrome b subunit of formate dehydrogenase
MVQNKSPQQTNTLSRWFGSQAVAYLVIAIATILLAVAGIFLYRKLQHTKFELESCRSSCSSASAD